MAYASLGSNAFRMKHNKKLDLFEEKIIKDLSEKYKKSPAQILLNWSVHQGNIIIPKTTNTGRLAENLNVYDFNLTDDEYNLITSLDNNGRGFDPISMKGDEFHDKHFNGVPYFN